MNKVKYSSYAADFKLKVIEYAEKHENRAAGREFTVSKFNKRYWRKQKDALLQTTNKSRKAIRGPKSGKLLNLKMRYSNKLGICAMKVSVSRTKCCISKHAR
jgi:hypothetical protein